MKKIVLLFAAAYLALSCSKNDCNCKKEEKNETFVFQEKEAINESYEKGKFNPYDNKLECRSKKEVYPTYEYKKEENKLYLEIEANGKPLMIPQKITLENNNTQLTIYNNYYTEKYYKVYTKQK